MYHESPSILLIISKNCVIQLAAVPNLKIDYVVINAGVLRYPNVSNIPNSWTLHLANIDRELRRCMICAGPSDARRLADILPRTFDEFAFHLHTNCIGPIILAQRLLQTMIPIGTIAFMSSDSGSAQNFREMEDGFAAYAASKAALNQALRHMAAELKRKDDDTIILALHPGEVAT